MSDPPFKHVFGGSPLCLIFIVFYRKRHSNIVDVVYPLSFFQISLFVKLLCFLQRVSIPAKVESDEDDHLIEVKNVMRLINEELEQIDKRSPSKLAIDVAWMGCILGGYVTTHLYCNT